MFPSKSILSHTLHNHTALQTIHNFSSKYSTLNLHYTPFDSNKLTKQRPASCSSIIQFQLVNFPGRTLIFHTLLMFKPLQHLSIHFIIHFFSHTKFLPHPFISHFIQPVHSALAFLILFPPPPSSYHKLPHYSSMATLAHKKIEDNVSIAVVYGTLE